VRLVALRGYGLLRQLKLVEWIYRKKNSNSFAIAWGFSGKSFCSYSASDEGEALKLKEEEFKVGNDAVS